MTWRHPFLTRNDLFWSLNPFVNDMIMLVWTVCINFYYVKVNSFTLFCLKNSISDTIKAKSAFIVYISKTL